MKKQILNLGKALNKAEQKQINGGYPPECSGEDFECGIGMYCDVPRALCMHCQVNDTHFECLGN